MEWKLKQSIREDLHALPPGKTEMDKFYIGYFDQCNLVAVMDLILVFPDDETASIGLFMMNQKYQGGGIGSKIIEDAAGFLNQKDFT